MYNKISISSSIGFFFILTCWATLGPAQDHRSDSLRTAYQGSAERVDQLKLALGLSKHFDRDHADSVLLYAIKAGDLLQKKDSLRLQFMTSLALSRGYYFNNRFSEQLEAAQQAQSFAYQMGDSFLIARSFRSMAMAKPAISTEEAITYLKSAIRMMEGRESEEELRFLAGAQLVLAYNLQHQAPHEAQEYRRKAMLLSIQTKDSLQLASCYNSIGIYFRNFNVDSALVYFSHASRINHALGRQFYLANNYIKLATCFELQELADSALYYADQGLKLAKTIDNHLAISMGLRIFYARYLNLEDFPEAMKYAREGMNLNQRLSRQALSLSISTVGDLHQKMGHMDSAEIYLERALEQGMKDRYPPGVATAHAHLGELDMKRKNYVSAREHFLQADEMYAMMNIQAARLRPFLRLGEMAFEESNFRAAKGHFEQVKEIASKLEDLSNVSIAHFYLAKCDSALGNLRSAFDHLRIHSELEDSISTTFYDEGVARLQTQLETEKKENEIKTLQQEAHIQDMQMQQVRQERNQLLTAGLIGLGIILVICFLLLQLQRSRKQIKQQAVELLALNQTKDDLFGIIAHDLRGPVSGFHTLGRIFERLLPEESPPRLKEIGTQIERQSAQLKQLLDNLLQWAVQQLGQYQPRIDAFSLEDLVKEVADLHSPAALGKGNTLNIDIPEGTIIEGDRHGWSIVLNNLISNAIKFTDKGNINIRWQETQEKYLTIEDTGIGMSETQLHQLHRGESLVSSLGTSGEHGTGLGLRMVRQLIQEWGGELAINSQEGQGTHIKIQLT